MQHLASKLSFVALGFVMAAILLVASIVHAATYPDPRQSGDIVASSTAYTLTFGATATRIVATSTGPGARVALTVQADSCGSGGTVYLQHHDVAAATSTGTRLGSPAATSTMTYGQDVPMVRGSIRAMAANATCTLLVTEWRTAP